MNIQIVPAKESQKSILQQLMELYSYDFSEFAHDDVNEHGLYGYSYLDHYWTDETRHPFFIIVDGHYAGFVLVTKHCIYTADSTAHNISEFFVMRKYRKAGVGRLAARRVFDMFSGMWEVRVLHINVAAMPFWAKVVAEYADGKHTFHPVAVVGWDGIGFTFDSRKK